MATRTITVQCKKCNGQKYIGKGNKTPCPKCIDRSTGKPTGKFTKEVDDGVPAVRR